MKKMISLIACMLVLVLSLTACSQAAPPPNSTSLSSGGILILSVNPKIAVEYDESVSSPAAAPGTKMPWQSSQAATAPTTTASPITARLTTASPTTMTVRATTKEEPTTAIKDRPAIKLRHELKHSINSGEDYILSARLRKLFPHDRHAGPDGSYRISSLYFDTPYD